MRLSTTFLLAAGLASLPAAAQEAEPEPCPGLVAAAPALVRPAALAWRVAEAGQIKLSFIGHSTFWLESPGGVTIATDYNDYVRARAVPVVATMNRAHSTHYSEFPDPAIKHVLRGWGRGGVPARHDLSVGDVQIRNVATNIRDWNGGTDYGGNSIFVFETGGLCVAHLGHLHHTLEPSHLKKLGRIDVLLVPVDGGYTLDTAGMMEVLRAINAPLMLPMHYFNSGTLDRFLARAKEYWPVELRQNSEITVSRASLPRQPTVVVLPGR